MLSLETDFFYAKTIDINCQISCLQNINMILSQQRVVIYMCLQLSKAL